jgi:hypothetical protein
MVVKIGDNLFVNTDHIEAMRIIKKPFPDQGEIYNKETNSVLIEIGYALQFNGTSGREYCGYVFKTSAVLMAWWLRATSRVIGNDKN